MRWVLPLVMSLVLLSSSRGRAETPQVEADWLSSEDSGAALGPATAQASDVQPSPHPRPRLSPAPGGAKPRGLPPEPRGLPPEPQWQYYGWQVLLADLANVGVGMAAHSWSLGIGGYFALPLVVHIAHGEPLRALGSAGLRFALPVLFARASAENGSFYPGMVVGSLLASLIDISALGWEPPAAPEPRGSGDARPAKAPERKPWFEPRVQPLPHGLSAGIVGGF